MNYLNQPIEFWNDILSRNPSQISRSFSSISPEEQIIVRAHLLRMTTEEGWHAEQRASARAALDILSLTHPNNA